ncbi:MAG: PfkB family carbohydrate kinase [Alkalispirochaeta sp.]
MDHFDVVGLGIATQDILAVTPKLPQTNDCFPIPNVEMQGGGPVATALVTLARLGATCSYLGAFAPDPIGQMIRTELTQYGVDISRSPIREKGVSSVSVILVEEQSGDRSILYQPGNANERSPEEIKPGWISSARVLHLDGFSRKAALRAAQIARAHQVKVSFDGGAGESLWQNMEELLLLVDILVVAKKFAAQVTGLNDPLESGPALLKKYRCQEVVITDGKQGSWYWDTKLHFHQPAFPIKAIDTTGAGDTFHGAYLYAYLQPHWNVPFRLKFASAVAALKCRQIGGRKGIPSLEEAVAFVEEGGKADQRDR